MVNNLLNVNFQSRDVSQRVNASYILQDFSE